MSGDYTDVDSALADLALTAVARLAAEMNAAPSSKDRIAAANSILDRLGYGRATRAQAEVADREIRNALEAAVGEFLETPKGIAQEQDKEQGRHSPAPVKTLRLSDRQV